VGHDAHDFGGEVGGLGDEDVEALFVDGGEGAVADGEDAGGVGQPFHQGHFAEDGAGFHFVHRPLAHQHPGVAQVAEIVNRHAADIHFHLAGFNGDEFLLFPGDGVIDFQHGQKEKWGLSDGQKKGRELTRPTAGLDTSGNCRGTRGADGAEILFWNDQNGKAQVFRAAVEPYPARLVLSDPEADLTSPRLAPDGAKMLYEARLEDRRIELRRFDPETKKTTVIHKTAPDYPPRYMLLPAWSPDGRKIVFADRASGNSEVFLMNADGSDLRNLTNEPLPDTNPTFSPDGSEIIFVRDFYGTGRLFRMNPDGSNQRRLTENQAYEMSPAFSPDGSRLAFAGDREGRGLDIFTLDFADPNNENLLVARRFHDSQAAFSPDGKRLAFVASSDGNTEIYLINTDGTGLFRLTHSKAEETAPQFTADGEKLIFASNRSGKFAIYEIELPSFTN